MIGDIPLWNVVYENNKHYMLYHVARHTYSYAEWEMKLVEVCRSPTIPDL